MDPNNITGPPNREILRSTECEYSTPPMFDLDRSYFIDQHMKIDEVIEQRRVDIVNVYGDQAQNVVDILHISLFNALHSRLDKTAAARNTFIALTYPAYFLDELPNGYQHIKTMEVEQEFARFGVMLENAQLSAGNTSEISDIARSSEALTPTIAVARLLPTLERSQSPQSALQLLVEAPLLPRIELAGQFTPMYWGATSEMTADVNKAIRATLPHIEYGADGRSLAVTKKRIKIAKIENLMKEQDGSQADEQQDDDAGKERDGSQPRFTVILKKRCFAYDPTMRITVYERGSFFIDLDELMYENMPDEHRQLRDRIIRILRYQERMGQQDAKAGDSMHKEHNGMTDRAADELEGLLDRPEHELATWPWLQPMVTSYYAARDHSEAIESGE